MRSQHAHRQSILDAFPELVTDHVRILSLSGTTIARILQDIQLVAEATNTEKIAHSLINAWQQEWLASQEVQTAPKTNFLMRE